MASPYGLTLDFIGNAPSPSIIGGHAHLQRIETFLVTPSPQLYFPTNETAFISIAMNAMKAKMKLIIIKNDFSNVKIASRAPGLFSSPRLIDTFDILVLKLIF